MEHIVRSLTKAPELTDYIEEMSENGLDEKDDSRSISGSEPQQSQPTRETSKLPNRRSLASLRRTSSRQSHRSFSPAASLDGKALESEKVTPEMENRFFSSPAGSRTKRFSEVSLADVADRHLRDKTDAITNIIRNISEQCAAAVEGLQLAHNAEHEETMMETEKHGSPAGAPSEDEEQSVRTEGSEVASEAGYEESSYLSPTFSKHSSIPPTPDLEHNRSSTSMSINSMNTASDRNSQSFAHGLSPKIMEDDAESERGSEAGATDHGIPQKTSVQTDNVTRPATSRVV